MPRSRLTQLLPLLLLLLTLIFGTEGLRVRPPIKSQQQQQQQQQTQARWASEEVDDFEQRIESGKVAVLASVAGSICHAPFSLSYVLLSGAGLSPQYEFNTDMLALTLALFGVVYRYAIRGDGNPNLKQGVVGAFALTRALNLITVPAACTAIPLNCGAPLGYADWNILEQFALFGGGSFLAFGTAALAIEAAIRKGLIQKMP